MHAKKYPHISAAKPLVCASLHGVVRADTHVDFRQGAVESRRYGCQRLFPPAGCQRQCLRHYQGAAHPGDERPADYQHGGRYVGRSASRRGGEPSGRRELVVLASPPRSRISILRLPAIPKPKPSGSACRAERSMNFSSWWMRPFTKCRNSIWRNM